MQRAGYWGHVLLVRWSGAVGPGSGTASDPSTASTDILLSTDEVRERVELVSEVVIEGFGDERTAIVAVLLAVDYGFSLAQTLEGALEGRLRVDGLVLGADGTPLVPTRKPQGLLLDDRNAVVAEPASLRRAATPAPLPVPAIQVADLLLAKGPEVGAGGLALLLYSLERGYSLEQIVLAILANDRIDLDWNLLDADGRPIMPEDPTPRGWFTVWDGWQDPVRCQALEERVAVRPLPDPTTGASTTTAPIEEERRLQELITAAVGVYRVGPDLESQLLAQPDTIRVNYVVGEWTVATAGTVSGSLDYSYTDYIELTNEPSIEITWSVEIVAALAPLSVRDDGLAFSVAGLIDPDLGQLVAGPMSVFGNGDVFFER